MANTNFPSQSCKARSIKGFGEYISQLSHFEVFHSFVENKVFRYRDGTVVVAHEGNSLKDDSIVSHGVHNP
jgi:hypothetical protein